MRYRPTRYTSYCAVIERSLHTLRSVSQLLCLASWVSGANQLRMRWRDGEAHCPNFHRFHSVPPGWLAKSDGTSTRGPYWSGPCVFPRSYVLYAVPHGMCHGDMK